jgi:regulator of protease activity HflC (stomatin/prohibitin superfamily)
MKDEPRDTISKAVAGRRLWYGDFRLTIVGFILYLIILAGAVAASGAPPAAGFDARAAGTMIVVGIVAALIILFLPFWAVVLTCMAAGGIAIRATLGNDASLWPWAIVAVGLLLAPMVQLAQQWEKAVVFRLGRLRGLRGPGVFLIAPVIDRAPRRIDTRIRVVEFRHETTLTRDTVPVSVDAIAFWMVWDAEKATLEVEDYFEAVTLAAHAALRNAIGKHDLSSLLSEQERLGKEIQEYIDAKTNPWGVTILSIGITDIVITKELEDSLSRQAQAQRERQSRVILAEAEEEVADSFVNASRKYADNPTALQLRGMSITYEGLRKNGAIVLLPSGAVQELALGKVIQDTVKGEKPFADLTKGPAGEAEGTS